MANDEPSSGRRRSGRQVTYPDYVPDKLSRRALITRAAVATGAMGVAGWAALSPPNVPWSINDPDGLQGLPQPKPFRLPDFSVPSLAGRPGVSVARGAKEPHALLASAIDGLGGLRHFIDPGDTVLIKPNVAFDRSPVLAATSNPDLLEALIRMLYVDARAAEVRVADNPIESPADCFAKTGISAAADRGGARIYLPDGNAFDDLYTEGATLIETWSFFRRPFKGVDKVIGLATVKDHNLCMASLSIKNWYGLLGGRRNQFHQAIDEIIADLSIMIRPSLSILDGRNVLMENGPTGGDLSNVKRADAVLAATDPVAMDAWAFRHLLERSSPFPGYIAMAQARGAGKIDSPVLEAS